MKTEKQERVMQKSWDKMLSKNWASDFQKEAKKWHEVSKDNEKKDERDYNKQDIKEIMKKKRSRRNFTNQM